MYLEKINAPEDVKKLNIDEMHALAAEMRKALLFRLSKHGGHFGPNFGMVEATIAICMRSTLTTFPAIPIRRRANTISLTWGIRPLRSALPAVWQRHGI